MRRRLSWWVLILGVLLVAAPSSAGEDAAKKRWAPPKPTPKDFQVALTAVGPASIDGGVIVEYTVTNRATGPRSFCTYYVPLDTPRNEILEIVDARGKQAPYLGPSGDRNPPGPEAYVTLGPGESRGVRVDVRERYRLAPGTYRLRSGTGWETLPRSAPLTIEIAAGGVAAPTAGEALEAVLSAEPGASATKGVFLTLTVRNPGRSPQRFCDYHTPFEGIRNQFLELRDAQGKELPYRGMMAKRAAPTDEDYLSVAPGQSRGQRFDVREAYAPPPGRYTVRFTGGSISGLPASPAISVEIGP